MTDEVIVRVTSFFTIFALLAIWERLAARRRLTTSKRSRWTANLAITFLNPASVRLVSPLLPIGMAVLAEERAWGLMNNVTMPLWTKVLIAVIVLDLVIYIQHVLFHTLPVLWRLHMMHHADLDIDVTTGLRFHPLEIMISLGIKLAAVALLGPPVVAVLVFEILLNGTSMFNHSNIYVPIQIDTYLRLLVVTPDMHRVHHSVAIRETNSNFGFNLPWWDRLFGTYRAQPVAGHEKMTIGLSQFRDASKLTLWRLLVLPFVEDPGSYAINRRGKEPGQM